MRQRLFALVLAALALSAAMASSAQAAKVRSLQAWKKDNLYLVTVDLDGRTQPKSEPRARVDHVRKGQWVRITCQAVGQNAYGSRLWDKVGRYFVPDKYLKTYTDGRIPGAPACGKPKRKRSGGGPGLPDPEGGYASYEQIYDLGKRFKGWAYRELSREVRGRFSRYFPFKGCGKRIRVGKRCELEAPGPNGPVEVIAVNQYGFALKSLDGHPEGSGRTITFRWARSCSRMSDWQFCDNTYLQVNAWGPVGGASLFGPLNAATVAKHYWTNFAENIRERFPRCPPGKAWVQDKYRACLPVI